MLRLGLGLVSVLGLVLGLWLNGSCNKKLFYNSNVYRFFVCVYSVFRFTCSAVSSAFLFHCSLKTLVYYG